MFEELIENTRRQMVETGRQMYQRGFIMAAEGNLSSRIEDERILTTVSGVCKGELSPDDFVLVDLEGRVIDGDRPPSTELKMHLEVYRQRRDVRAVIHAHPAHVVSLTLVGESFDRAYLPESALLLGAVPVAPYARPSTGQVPESIRPFVRKSDIIVLERHGSLTVGKTFEDAFRKLEVLEHTARIIWLSRQVGEPAPLPAGEIEELMRLRRSVYGLDYPILPFK